MKTLSNIFVAIVSLSVFACGEPDYPTPIPSVTSLTSKLVVVHTIAGGPRMKIKIDNKITEKDTLRYEKAPDGKLYNTITLAVPAGPTRLINVAQYSDNTNLFVDRYAATAATNNTSFVVLKDNKTSVTRVSDDLSAPDPGVAKVRFLHFAADAGDMKVTDVGGATTIFSLRKYNDAKADYVKFSTLNAGTYTFEVRPSTPADSVVFTISNLKLDSKGIYTIYSKGLKNGAGSLGLSYGVIKH
jgi:hypothetical protein